MRKFKLKDVKDFYKSKKVLITGNTGFKGSWLSKWLLSMGAKVYGVSDTDKYDLYRMANIGEQIERQFLCDISSTNNSMEDGKQSIYGILDIVKPDVVFHLAAQPLVRESYLNPALTYQVNVMGTMHVALACKEAGVKHAVFITTDKCYENDESGLPIEETARFGGSDPYSSSKGCCEILMESLRRSYPECSGYFTARAGNVVGGGDWAKDRIIPDIVRAINSDTRKIVLRNPNSVRPWQHVLEPLYGYLLLGMQEDCHGLGINFGPNPYDSFTVLEVLSECDACLKAREQKLLDISIQECTEMKEANYLRLDNTFAKMELGWEPRLSFKETIGLTMAFYLDKDLSADGLLMRDICTYEEKLKANE